MTTMIETTRGSVTGMTRSGATLTTSFSRTA
jgi:hypothetical protein